MIPVIPVISMIPVIQDLEHWLEILFAYLATRALPRGRQFVERSAGIDSLAWVTFFRVIDVTADLAAVLRHISFIVIHISEF